MPTPKLIERRQRQPTGRLRLRFGSRAGDTVLREQEAEAPLKILRPFELDRGRVLLQILNVGPGIMAGDDYRLEVIVETGARVVLVNPAATRIHRAPDERVARQHISFYVQNDAELEYYPGLTIPYAGSSLTQLTEVELEPEARFAMLELWAMGRIGRGEAFAFRRLSSWLRLRTGTTPRYADALELSSETAPRIGLGDGHRYLAAGVRYGSPQWPPHLDRNERATLVIGQAEASLSYLRALAHDGLTLSRLVRSRLNGWREQQGMAAIPFERFGS